jgi:phage-related protein
MLDLAKHGESGRQAMSAAQSAFSKLTTTLPKTQAALAKVGVTAFTSSGQFVGIGDVIAQLQPKLKGLNEEQQLNYLRTIFGTAANKKMLETVLGGPAAFNAATRAVSDHNTVTKAATEAMNTLSGSMKVLSGELKDLVQKWGQELLPVVKGAIHIFTDVVKVIEHNKVVAFALAAVIGGILTAAVLTFIWTAGSKMVKTIGEMSESIGKLVVKCGEGVASMLGLGEAGEISGAEMAAGLAIGTLGIAVVIAGLYELWKHWKTVFKFIEDIAKKAWETLKQGFTIFLRFWERLWGDAEQMVVSVWHAIDDVFHSIQQAFSDVVDFIRAHWELIVAILLAPFVPILAAVVLFHDQIIGFFRDIYDTIVSIWQSLVTGLKHAWDDVTGFFTGLWSNYIWPAIKTVITDFEHLGTTIIHALLGGMKQAWNDVTSWFSSALHGIASFFGFGSSSTTTSINGSLGPVTKNVTAVINKIMSGASGGTSGQVGYLPHHASTAAAITITVHAPVTLTGQKIATTISTKVRVNMLSNKGRQTYNLYGGSAGRFSPTGG